MTISFLLASALLAQSAALPSPEAGVRSMEADSPTITASARTYRSYGWLTTAGPDAQGHYVVWIKVADLDPATDAGFAAMSSRVQRATAVLCDISAEQPQIPGFYNRGARECLRNTQDQASEQMQRVQDAARHGRPVAVLGVTR